MMENILKALFVTVGLALVWEIFELLRRTEKPVFRTVLHALSGLAALLTANTLGALAGLTVGLNAVTMAVSAALGVPGVALLWAVRYLL